jgi:hypothetical protein
MTSEKSKPIKIEIPKELSGLLQKHHDSIVADETLADVDVLLISLYLIENNNNKAGASQEDCRRLFASLGRRESNFPVVLHRAKGSSFIQESNGILHFMSGGLKKIRNIFGQVEKSPVYVIKSGQNFTAIKLFEEFLSQLKGEEILLCDPHISNVTLFPFSNLKDKFKSMKILTTNIYDHEKFESYKKKMSKELGVQIEIRTNQKIHDRFIICGDKCWTIGSSIKDLGNKDATIREISEVTSSMKYLFSERWNEPES